MDCRASLKNRIIVLVDKKISAEFSNFTAHLVVQSYNPFSLKFAA